jgi:hypothetical protein
MSSETGTANTISIESGYAPGSPLQNQTEPLFYTPFI